MNELQRYYLGSLEERGTELGALRHQLAERVAAGDRSARLPSQTLEALHKISHQLKGTGASYGYPEISEAAAKVESEISQLRVAAEGDRQEALSKTLATVVAFLAVIERILASAARTEVSENSGRSEL